MQMWSKIHKASLSSSMRSKCFVSNTINSCEAFYPSLPLLDSDAGIRLFTDVLSAISDSDLARINAAPHMRQSWLDEVQAEISMCLGMLYPIIEVFRSDADFAEDLSKWIPVIAVPAND